MDSHNLPSYLFMPRNTKAFVPRVNFILRSFRRSLCFFAFFLARFRDPCSIGFRSNSSQQRSQIPAVLDLFENGKPRRKSTDRSNPLDTRELDIDIRHRVPPKTLLSSKYFDCSSARCNFLPASFPFPREIQFFHFEDPSFSR